MRSGRCLDRRSVDGVLPHVEHEEKLVEVDHVGLVDITLVPDGHEPPLVVEARQCYVALYLGRAGDGRQERVTGSVMERERETEGVEEGVYSPPGTLIRPRHPCQRA